MAPRAVRPWRRGALVFEAIPNRVTTHAGWPERRSERSQTAAQGIAQKEATMSKITARHLRDWPDDAPESTQAARSALIRAAKTADPDMVTAIASVCDLLDRQDETIRLLARYIELVDDDVIALRRETRESVINSMRMR
jgi:hypothetical protein